MHPWLSRGRIPSTIAQGSMLCNKESPSHCSSLSCGPGINHMRPKNKALRLSYIIFFCMTLNTCLGKHFKLQPWFTTTSRGSLKTQIHREPQGIFSYINGEGARLVRFYIDWLSLWREVEDLTSKPQTVREVPLYIQL